MRWVQSVAVLTNCRLEQERDRLARNAERHAARARAKGLPTAAASPEAASPADPGSTPDGAAVKGKGKKKQTGQTQRRCANCGQVGHIKTNKRLVDDFICSTCEYMNTPIGDMPKKSVSKVPEPKTKKPRNKNKRKNP